MRSIKYLITACFFIVFSSFVPTKNTNKKIQEKLAYVVENLDKATFNPIRVGWQYDYGFASGGVLNKFEYIRSLMSYAEFQSMLDYPIYLSGPHSENTLNLESEFTFGHFNPKFVSDLRENINKIIGNKYFVKYTKPIIERYNFLLLLERYNLVYNEIKIRDKEFARIKKSYEDWLKNKNGSRPVISDFLPEILKSGRFWAWGYDGIEFWLRRDVDGTKEIWAGIITDILNTYK